MSGYIIKMPNGEFLAIDEASGWPYQVKEERAYVFDNEMAATEYARNTYSLRDGAVIIKQAEGGRK